ncbi:amidohydrolase family protein [Loktanella salsilacus]|uniref:amidohydrolase family protein n=1 Tax=Loktanella salsilacus TaxID=195913 RepID=UPI0037350F8D
MQSTPETAVDWQMPTAIVDAHHHLWDLACFPYPWLAPHAPPRPFGNHDAIKRNFLPADYGRHFNALPLIASVHVQANCGTTDPSDETAWLAGLAAQTGMPDAVVGGIDLMSPDAPAVLAAHSDYPILRGLRALVAHDIAGRWRFASRPFIMANPVFRRHAALIAEMGLSLDLVIAPEQLEEVAALASALPDLSIIIDHLATAETATFSRWLSGTKAVSGLENVTIKLSGLWTIDKGWRAAQLQPYVLHVLDCFGADRLMYGSNAPIETLHCSVTEQIAALAGIIGRTNPAAIDSVFSKTASRIYRLDAA